MFGWMLLYSLLWEPCPISRYWLSTMEATQTKAELSINEIVGAMDQAIPEDRHLNFPGK